MDITDLPVKPQKKRAYVCVIITILNIYSFVMYSLVFAVFPLMETLDITFVLVFLLALPIYIGWLMPPVLLVSSILYAIIRRKLYPQSLIPIASFVCLALLLYILSFTSSQIYNAATKSRLRRDGTAVVNMIQTGQLRPDEDNRVYLPEEYQRLSNLDYVVVEYAQDGSVYVFVDYTFGILIERSGYLYTESGAKAAARIAGSYGCEITRSIIPNWYSIHEIT